MHLTRFIMYLSLPAVLLQKLSSTEFEMLLDMKFLGTYLFSIFSIMLISGIIGFFIFEKKSSNGVMIGLGSVYGNIGFLGIPVLAVTVGEWTSVPLALMLTIDLIFLLPLSAFLLQLSTMQSLEGDLTPLKALKRSLFNPLIISIVLGLSISAFTIEIPVLFNDGLKLLGSAAGPCAMFIVGVSLVGRKISAKPYEAGVMSFFKLCITPLFVFTLMTIFNISPDWIMAATLGAAMPCASVLGVIAEEYKTMPFQASSAVVITTLLAAGTLPLYISFLSN